MTTPEVLGERRPYGEQVCMVFVGTIEEDATMCRQQATAHLLWVDGESSLACAEHAPWLRTLAPLVDEHPFGAMCNMPSTQWLRSIPPIAGRCLWEVDAETFAEAIGLDG